MALAQETGTVSALGVAGGKGADRKAAPSENNRGLARLICGQDLQLALSTLGKIGDNQRALAYVAKNGDPKVGEKAVEMLSGILDVLTDTGAIMAVATRSKDADAKAAAGARILNMATELVYRKPKRSLTADEFGALAFISEKHPDEILRTLADCKLPTTSKADGVEFTEEVVTFDADRLAEILEATQA